MTDDIIVKDPKPEGYKIPEKIVDKNIAGLSSLTIPGLDGNRDQKYEIIVDGAIVVGAAPYLTTSLSNQWQGSLLKFGTDVAPANATAVDGSGRPLIGDAYLAGNSTNQVLITMELYCASGRERKFRCDAQIRNASGNRRAICGANQVSDYTTNITSITLNFGGAFTGNVKVYPVKPE